jgi:hypothetical protein
MYKEYKGFVIAWMESHKKGLGVKSVAEKCGLTIATASAKANYMRKRGVKLPAMRRAKATGLDVTALNELILTRENN